MEARIRYCDCCGRDREVNASLMGLGDHDGAVLSKYDIITCITCSHSFLDPMPSKEEITGFYLKKYYAHNELVQPESLRKKMKKRLRSMGYGHFSKNLVLKIPEHFFYLIFRHTINEAPFVVGGRYLDIGCGTGEHLEEMNRYGWEMHGIELNENAVRIAKKRGMNVVTGEADNLPYPDGYFNVVRIWNVLEHLISPRKAISEISRVLKKNGHLVAYVPNYNSSDRKYFSEFWFSLEVPRHCHHFSHASINAYLNQAGLELKKWMYPGTVYSTLHQTIKIMRNNKVSGFFVFRQSAACLMKKFFNRLLGNYSEDVGICILALKI